MSGHHHGTHGGGPRSRGVASRSAVVALLGAPNAGKTSVFTALTGIRAKTGNYPGVTVARNVGGLRGADIAIEDLPGTYSLHALSPDEKVVVDAVEGVSDGAPDALAVVVDATTLRRSLTLVADALRLRRPTCLVVTMTDELAARGGAVDLDALSRAVGIPVVPVIATRGIGIDALRTTLLEWRSWAAPALTPPGADAEQLAWIDAVLEASGYRPASADPTTRRIDRILLHPVWGVLTFAVVMFTFFQAIFTVAAPAQGWIEEGFAWLSGVVIQIGEDSWFARMLSDAVIGGVGGVLVFLPQIFLMFLLIALLEGIGYMARAALLMDRVMAIGGLEGRAFVAMLSSFACAIPGIMATRTMPNARDRLATILSAPLITCSARLPVYVLLVGLLVPADAWLGPVQVQGLVMFGLYALGGTTAMLAASVAKRLQGGRGAMPFAMELPPYRMPTARAVFAAIWMSAGSFLRKAGTIILATTIVLWGLLNLPVASSVDMAAAGVDLDNPVAVQSYTMDHSIAAGIGHALEPVFAPLGFDWRVNVGILASLSAREAFVSTMGQIAAATDPEDPAQALSEMTYDSGPNEGEPVFTAPTVIALLFFFAFALQCMATVGVMRRETGSWRWPAIAFGYMFVLAWTSAFIAHSIAAAVMGGSA